MRNNGVILKIGSELNELTIKKVLGSGTFGITYLAEDNYLNKQVVIKEYFPNDIAVRNSDSTISAKTSSDKENFEYALSSFLKEAQVLAKFNHLNIVRVNSFCESNGTAYFLMDYEAGEDLQSYLSRYNSLSEKEILSIIMPILDGLRDVHDANFLHRDIKPGNIYIRENSSPMLIDFGASRMAMGVKSKSLSVILTEGYAPKEQYSSTSKQDAYTDLYSIGAVMYKMATGVTPPEASARADAITDDEDDPLVRLQDRKDLDYSINFKKAIDWALSFRGKDRPQSVMEFQRALDSTQVNNQSTSPKPILEKEKKKKIENNTQKNILSNEIAKEKTNYYTKALKNYANFTGRATRPEYWYFTLINTVISILLLFIDIGLQLDGPIFSGIYTLCLLIPTLSILTRRLHDVGKSAWLMLLMIIPYGALVLIIFAMLKSDENNEYGNKK